MSRFNLQILDFQIKPDIKTNFPHSPEAAVSVTVQGFPFAPTIVLAVPHARAFAGEIMEAARKAEEAAAAEKNKHAAKKPRL